jgi:hypothetical protein
MAQFVAVVACHPERSKGPWFCRRDRDWWPSRNDRPGLHWHDNKF